MFLNFAGKRLKNMLLYYQWFQGKIYGKTTCCATEHQILPKQNIPHSDGLSLHF